MPIKVLPDGTKWVKAVYWDGKPLKGKWLATIKIDGCRMIRGKDGNVYSRDGKRIKHVKYFDFNDAEYFFKDWNTTVGMLHSDEQSPLFSQEHIYNLDPIDSRLILGELDNPEPEMLEHILSEVLELGYEGLVLRQGNKWIKVVPVKYADVRILDIKEGQGKYKGICGSIETTLGSVGSIEKQEGYSDPEFRDMLLRNRDKYLGKIIQVGYRELTVTGKLKFPKMVRLRLDKDYEDLPNEQ